MCSVGPHLEDVELPVTALGEGDPPAAWGVLRTGLEEGVVGEAALMGAISSHHVDFGIAVPSAGKGDLAAVGREDGGFVRGALAGEATNIAAVRPHHVDVPYCYAARGRTRSSGRPGRRRARCR